MNFKRFLISITLVGATAATVLTGVAEPASADSLSREEAALLAGVGGFVLGATIASPGIPYRPVYPAYDTGYDGASAWDIHVARCYARYRSYDEATDTFIGRDGYERRCRL